MSDLIEQDNEDVSLQVPQGLEGPDDINLWYNLQGVAKANVFYHTRMVDGNSNQINEAKRFRDQLENAYHEAEIGSSPKVRKLRESTISIHQNMQRVNDYLYLSLEGETRQGQLEDLGDERLNRMLLLLDSRFQRMERRMERIMERGMDVMKRDMDVMKRDMNEGFTKLEKQLKNSTYRMENKLKGK